MVWPDKRARDWFWQLLSLTLSLAIASLFLVLWMTEIVLPKHTAQYSLKNAQQVVNLVVAVIAILVGLLLNHCLSLTNEAETAAELRLNRLTLPRLHAHANALGGSRTAIALHALKNRKLWLLAAFYLAAMTLFGVVNSVLSVVFVLDTIIDQNGTPMDAYFPLSADIPPSSDTCVGAVANPHCTYDLALTALSSLLVTHQPYTIAGVTFISPNGTLGLPYQAMAHFAKNVSTTTYEDEYRQYCLPVLSPNIITCKEVAVNQLDAVTYDGTVAFFAPNMSLPVLNDSVVTDAYFVSLNQRRVLGDGAYLRVDDQGNGTMTVAQLPDEQDTTIVTATAFEKRGYAAMLYEMMNGSPPPEEFTGNQADFKYVAACTIPDIRGQTAYSSWNKVSFTLHGGILHANVTGEECPNPRNDSFSGFANLQFALQGAASILSGTDGYTKLINLNEELGDGTPIFSNMNLLETALSKIYHTIQTAWSQTGNHEALQHPDVQSRPITMLYFPHLLVIRISWTPTTWVGLGIAVALAIATVTNFARWFRATGCLAADEETWNLLEPVDLMAYALAAYQDLSEVLSTPARRKAQVKVKPGRILKDYPVGEGTESLLGLVRSTSPKTPRSGTRSAVPSSGSTAFSPLLSDTTPPRGQEKDSVSGSRAVSWEEQDPFIRGGGGYRR